MRALVLAVSILVGCANPPDAKPDRSMRPDGTSWFCSTERSGMLSVCERTRKSCKRAKKFLAGLSHRRGDYMTLGPCKRQPRAYCLTAERLIPKAKPPKPEDEQGDEEDEEEDEESEEDAERAEADETDDGDRFVLEDKIWLCYSSTDNCEQQRKNMYYMGFTHVSTCAKWK